ncbi:glycerol-3-phosphate dehydrogenase/oxidase [Dinghuibacter silviterrae]|uniref:Glycerol-3-phosphate dehydrogenase n=1 Tax=Dinghuibacter silviterrae TaxID=1539049 RepID=A0A4R8DVH2_9BACT|nr:glycerol-3-phosphate dehydrogenase/oxidase [Dinghuibacter silviterrae]TDX01191.1 glycerol-3-phosphate dehydrogenase [Dinghuibacter silviterrae]
MNRADMLHRLEEAKDEPWDVVVIGGGATGLGVALDSASRGYRTVLLERDDFAKGTSSRSTKLVHGGVRYLQEGDVGLVREALYERGLLLKNAPHLVHKENFIIPLYTRWKALWYMMGLTVYDLLSGRASFGPSRLISRQEVIRRLPGIFKKRLRGGVIYLDGQFNDARLAINLAQTAVEQGALVINHIEVTQLFKNAGGAVCGVRAVDRTSGRFFDIFGRAVVNATGVFVDEVLQMDNPGAAPQVRPSQGVHLVLEQSFLGQEDALLIPKTEDGRVLFGVPWEGKLLVGTTDTPLNTHSAEPRALEEEVSFILRTAGQYFEKAPGRSDVLSVFAGLRPLAAPKNGDTSTKEISRSHKIIRSPSGLVTITGGKWTTYRRMAEDTVDEVIRVAGLEVRACVTHELGIHGAGGAAGADAAAKPVTGAAGAPPAAKPAKGVATGPGSLPRDHLSLYGSDRPAIEALQRQHPAWGALLDPRLPFTGAEVVWAVRSEEALTVEDVLARRVRALFLDARAAIAMAPAVAELMATELGKDEAWKQGEVAAFTTLAKGYLLG